MSERQSPQGDKGDRFKETFVDAWFNENDGWRSENHNIHHDSNGHSQRYDGREPGHKGGE